MKLLALLVLSAVAGCATTYNGPKSGDIVSLCYAEKRDLYLVGDCFEEKLTKYMPGWRNERDYYEVTMFTDFIRAKGLAVKDGAITEADAYRDVIAYNNRKTSQAQAEKAQQSQIRANNSAALIQAGTMLMTAPPVYAPPAYIPPYPSDTTINIQQTPPYRFYDSRPYK